MSTVSYLITTHNETTTLGKLLYAIGVNKHQDDEIVILDDFSNNPETQRLLKEFDSPVQGYHIYQHALSKDYGSHKNAGIEKCSKNYIFQLDGDEMPPESLLGENLHALIDSNPSIEAYAVPRINAWEGLTTENAKQWGWPLDMSPTYNRVRAAWPDFQWRIFKRDYPRISFHRRLHEKIEGYNSYAGLPAEEEWALYHDKTIEKQIETNLRYNKLFSEDDNRGHKAI